MTKDRATLERIASYENLTLAWRKAIRGKRDKKSVRQFSANLDANLRAISDELLAGVYVWGRLTQFTIYDPKERTISVAPFRDRVTQHAIINILESRFDRFLIDQTYACRKGKGQFAALERAVSYSRSAAWFLKLDVRKYFYTIPHATLLASLARLFPEPDLMALLTDLVDSYEDSPGVGIPIGSLTSQFFANHYLGVLDHYAKEVVKARRYVRYMDDFILWSDNKAFLRDAWRRIEEFAAVSLSLALKPPILNRARCGLPFLGVKVYPNGFRLSRAAQTRFRRKYRADVAAYQCGRLSQFDLVRRVDSLFAFARRAQSYRYRMKIINETPIEV